MTANQNVQSVKMRLHRARKHAAESLRAVGYGVIMTSGGTFDLIAVRENTARFIRITVNEKCQKEAATACRRYTFPDNCQCEIWKSEGGSKFAITSV